MDFILGPSFQKVRLSYQNSTIKNLGKSWTEEEKELSRHIMKVWTDFAKTGNPGFDEFKLSKSQHIFSIPNNRDESLYRKRF